MHIKEHGKEGKLRIRYPANNLQHLFRVGTFEAVIKMIRTFPNYRVEERQNVTANVTIESVTYFATFENWHKYQGDYSGDRVRRHRSNVTANVTVQEEKRSRREVEENRKEVVTPSAPDSRVKLLSDAFYEGLKLKAGEKPVHNFGESGKALKALLAVFPETDIQARISHWFRSTDPFIEKVNWRFSEFHRNFNKLKEGPIYATRTNQTSHVRLAVGDPERAKAYDRAGGPSTP